MTLHNAPTAWAWTPEGQRHRRAYMIHAMIRRGAGRREDPVLTELTVEQIRAVLVLDAAVRGHDGLVTVRRSDLPADLQELIQ